MHLIVRQYPADPRTSAKREVRGGLSTFWRQEGRLRLRGDLRVGEHPIRSPTSRPQLLVRVAHPRGMASTTPTSSSVSDARFRRRRVQAPIGTPRECTGVVPAVFSRMPKVLLAMRDRRGVRSSALWPVFTRPPRCGQKFRGAGVRSSVTTTSEPVGATITHRVVANLFEDRGFSLRRTLPSQTSAATELQKHAERERLVDCPEGVQDPVRDVEPDASRWA